MASRYTLRPFAPGDETKLPAWPVMPWNPRHDRPPGPTWSLCEGKTVLAIGGAVEVADGRWQLWSHKGAMPLSAYAFAMRAVVNVTNLLFEMHRAQRVECYVRSDHPAGYSFAKRTGFQFCGPKRGNQVLMGRSA